MLASAREVCGVTHAGGYGIRPYRRGFYGFRHPCTGSASLRNGAHGAPLQSLQIMASGHPLMRRAGMRATRWGGNRVSLYRRGRVLPVRGPCVAANFRGRALPAPTIVVLCFPSSFKCCRRFKAYGAQCASLWFFAFTCEEMRFLC